MRKILMLLAATALLSACATAPTASTSPMQPYAKAAVTLRAAQTSIATAAKTVDSLCTQNVLKQDKCNELSALYSQTKAAWSAAREGLLVSLEVGTMDQYDASKLKLDELTNKLLAAVAQCKQ